jgi:nucleoid-associated protein YgaU
MPGSGRSVDPVKPSRQENELQPAASETEAVTRNIAGETQPKAAPLDDRGSNVYVVQEGDTLAGIAKKFYGEEALWRRILDANRDRLNDNDQPEAGAQLRIPRAQ